MRQALFGSEVADCPSGERGPCSYTPQAQHSIFESRSTAHGHAAQGLATSPPPSPLQNLSLALGEWSRHELLAKARFAPDTTGYHGAAGMVSIELLSAGSAWVDDVVLTLRNNTR